MDFKALMKSFGLTMKKNSPEILTGLGLAGMISAIVIGIKMAPKANKVVENEITNRLENGKTDDNENVEGLIKVPHDKNGEYGHYRLPVADIFKLTWKYYLPCVVTATASGVCIIGASVINHKRNAMLATAFSMSELALKEYKDKVLEKIGEEDAKKINDSVAKDIVEKNPPKDSEIIDTGRGKTLLYDPMSATYFYSTMENVSKAVNETNNQLLHSTFVTVNDFLLNLGLHPILIGDEIGWDFDHGMIDISFSGDVVYDQGTSCIVLNYTNYPIHL